MNLEEKVKELKKIVAEMLECKNCGHYEATGKCTGASDDSVQCGLAVRIDEVFND